MLKRVKQSISVLVALMLVIAVMPQNELFAKGLIKIWRVGTGGGYTWSYRYDDQWGGRNYWCIIPGGSDCSHCDWMAGNSNVDNDPSPGINTVYYGVTVIQQEADATGITLPSDLQTPVFEMIVEE